MFFVYVLENEAGRKYTGHTFDLAKRLEQHNDGATKSTKGRGKWTLIFQEEYATRAAAMRREKFLKSGQGREALKKILSQQRSSAG